MFKRKNVVLTRPDKPRGETPVKPERVQPQHPGVRPSRVYSAPCISTSSRTLDRALAHGGVPLGTVTLLEEHGTTDFVSALLKSMSTLAVTEAREGIPSKVICVGIPEWLRSLPSLAKPGTSRRSHTSSSTTNNSDARMKIAWRYAKYSGSGEAEPPSAFCRDVDFKSNLVPAPQAKEVSYVLGRSLEELARGLQTELSRTPKETVVRVVMPSFLHPAVYPNLDTLASPQSLYPFFARIKQIVASFGNAAAFISIPLQLYPRTRSVVAGLELLVDTCVEIEPFDSGDENVQGFLHIIRIAGLSDRGEVSEQRQELSFRLTRHQFEVTPYSIPVEVEEEVKSESKDTEAW